MTINNRKNIFELKKKLFKIIVNMKIYIIFAYSLKEFMNFNKIMNIFIINFT